MERETKEVKLSNGDKLFFVARVKGKHIRKMNQRMFGDKSVNLSNPSGAEISMSDAFDSAKYFDIFVEKIISGDKEIEASIEYVDELDAEDYYLVMEMLDKLTGQKKKAKK